MASDYFSSHLQSAKEAATAKASYANNWRK